MSWKRNVGSLTETLGGAEEEFIQTLESAATQQSALPAERQAELDRVECGRAERRASRA